VPAGTAENREGQGDSLGGVTAAGGDLDGPGGMKLGGAIEQAADADNTGLKRGAGFDKRGAFDRGKGRGIAPELGGQGLKMGQSAGFKQMGGVVQALGDGPLQTGFSRGDGAGSEAKQFRGGWRRGHGAGFLGAEIALPESLVDQGFGDFAGIGFEAAGAEVGGEFGEEGLAWGRIGLERPDGRSQRREADLVLDAVAGLGLQWTPCRGVRGARLLGAL
jgi:hypothetical protein